MVSGTMYGSVADTSSRWERMSSAVGSRRCVGDPALAESHEDPRIAAGARRVVAMGEVAGATCEERHQRHDQFGPDRAHEAGLGQELLVADGFGDHAREAGGENGVRENAVCRALDGDHVGQPDESGLGRRVVRLHRLPEIARRRRDEHEPAVLLLRHHLEGGLAEVEAAVEMHPQHVSPVVGGELVERNAVEDARIADDDVEAPEGVDRRVDDGLPALGAVDRVVRGDRACRLPA